MYRTLCSSRSMELASLNFFLPANGLLLAAPPYMLLIPLAVLKVSIDFVVENLGLCNVPFIPILGL